MISSLGKMMTRQRPAFRTINRFKRRVQDEATVQPDYAALNRVYTELYKIDRNLSCLSAPELTGWKEESGRVVRSYDLFGNDYTQDTVLYQPMPLKYEGEAYFTQGTMSSKETVPGMPAPALEFEMSIRVKLDGYLSQKWLFTVQDIPAIRLCEFIADYNSKKLIVGVYKNDNTSTKIQLDFPALEKGIYLDMTISCDANRNITVADNSNGEIMCTGNITVENQREVQTGVRLGSVGDSYDFHKVYGFTFTVPQTGHTVGFDAGRPDYSKWIFNWDGLVVDRNKIGFTIGFGGIAVGNLKCDYPADKAFTGYAAKNVSQTPDTGIRQSLQGDTFTISCDPSARVIFASVHDQAKQAEVLAALQQLFGYEFIVTGKQQLYTDTFTPDQTGNGKSYIISTDHVPAELSVVNGKLRATMGPMVSADVISRPFMVAMRNMITGETGKSYIYEFGYNLLENDGCPLWCKFVGFNSTFTNTYPDIALTGSNKITVKQVAENVTENRQALIYFRQYGDSLSNNIVIEFNYFRVQNI